MSSNTWCVAALAAALAAPLQAGSQTWTFGIATEGEDVSWTSSTPVDPGAFAYSGEYEITSVIATVLIFGLPADVDATDLIPPEDLTGTGEATGPAPVVLINETVVAPPPPDPPAVEADLFVGLDAMGFGTLEATDIVLGSVDLGFPFGVVDIIGFQIAGQITVTPMSNPADVNGDGAVDVSDLTEVVLSWGMCPAACPADVNGDGIVDVADLVAVILGWG